MESVDFSGIFQALPGNYIILLPDAPRFSILAFNDARAEQTFTRQDHIGKGIFEAFPDNPDDPNANGVAMLTASLQTVLREKKPHQMAVQKYDIPTADRAAFEERYWLPRNIPVLDDKGEVKYIIHHVQDLTAQVLAEQRMDAARRDLTEEITARKKVEYAEETIRLALESADLGTYELNLATDEMTTNPRFNAIWGYDQPVLHSVIADAVHHEDQPLRLKAHQESLLTGSLFYEVRIVRRDQSVRWIRVNGKTIFDDQHHPLRLLGVAQDITEQKAFTDELTRLVEERTSELQKMNQRLEISNHELEQFAYVTSHDLQEPLRKIQVYSSRIMRNSEWNSQNPQNPQNSLNPQNPQNPENLQNPQPPQNPQNPQNSQNSQNLQNPQPPQNPQIAADLEKISASAGRMRALINNLLDYSRLSDTQTPFEPTDLNKVLSQVLSDFEVDIAQKNASIRAEHLATIDAVPLQMTQLFINLLGNALKFTRKDRPPVITITGSNLTEKKKARFPALAPGRDYYEIVFSDNGIGFDQAHAGKIFTLFQRLNHNGDYSGHGIGLALCSKVVSYHQGIIRAESNVNEGASFTVILPCYQGPPA
jgi:PAS domain S-box-containing protein